MKIDIHTHTKKIKQGDSANRNIEVKKFSEIIKTTDVKILAITNHNHFDYDQYQTFKDDVEGLCQIWPGVEFDIREEGRKAHLIIIVNPIQVKAFNLKITEVLGNVSADDFYLNIDHVVTNFKEFDAIWIAHYHSKRPNLSNVDLEKLLSLVPNQKRVLKEASNSISAGIYISHGHNSIHGSDVQDWNDYVNLAKDLPELRLPVESFEQFCLLLDKDEATINTILHKKSKENITLNPFHSAAEVLTLDIYNDINILFGSKGTGKTEILKAISRHYNGKGYKTDVYESNSKKIEEVFDLKGAQLKVETQEIGLDDCQVELASLRNAVEKEITPLSKYLLYYTSEATNKISKNIQINKFTPLDEKSLKRVFLDMKNNLKEFQTFKNYYSNQPKLKDIIGDELLTDLNNLLTRIIDKIATEAGTRYMDFKSVTLFNQMIKIFVLEISKKTGQPEKPTGTGFSEYASNRISIERALQKILENISKKIEPRIEEVGNLGEKGRLFCKTNLVIQNGKIAEGKYKHINSTLKTPQKSVAAQLDTIYKHIYSSLLFEKIDDLKKIENSDVVVSISDLILFHKHFTLNDDYYVPSNGESSMVLLHNELTKEQDIYLIDEPEKSLGNDYISEVIVPLIKEKAKMGKKIIIATHDANIAVRTLPYNSIYREHDINGYYTYCGNPFSNSLVCSSDKKPSLDWKLISMKTLEGGKAAFGERGKIYGNA